MKHFIKRWKPGVRYKNKNMIYVLFGPPGVGKTYIGGLVSSKLGMRFFDADVLFDEELKSLLRNGQFKQIHRDKYFEKLFVVTEHLMSELKEGQDLLIAQAFIKNKNRDEFSRRFDKHVRYILVKASRVIALDRMHERVSEERTHVVDEGVFNYSWEEFEEPRIQHDVMINVNQNDEQLFRMFNNLIK